MLFFFKFGQRSAGEEGGVWWAPREMPAGAQAGLAAGPGRGMGGRALSPARHSVPPPRPAASPAAGTPASQGQGCWRTPRAALSTRGRPRCDARMTQPRAWQGRAGDPEAESRTAASVRSERSARRPCTRGLGPAAMGAESAARPAAHHPSQEADQAPPTQCLPPAQRGPESEGNRREPKGTGTQLGTPGRGISEQSTAGPRKALEDAATKPCPPHQLGTARTRSPFPPSSEQP